MRCIQIGKYILEKLLESVRKIESIEPQLQEENQLVVQMQHFWINPGRPQTIVISLGQKKLA